MVDSSATLVGPVLEASEAGRAIVSAILRLNPGALVHDRGSYLRVLSPGQCIVTREAIELELHRAFRLPVDLELVMPAFKGLIAMSDERVEWRFAE